MENLETTRKLPIISSTPLPTTPLPPKNHGPKLKLKVMSEDTNLKGKRRAGFGSLSRCLGYHAFLLLECKH